MYANYQQNATAQQPEMTWNGTSWVPSATLHTTHTTYETSLNGKNLVQLYTEYYHAYTEQAQRWEPHLQSPDPKMRSDADQQYRWAKYQADESSRAAHFFHQNPGATIAPFDLPPPPAHYTEVIHSSSLTSSHNQNFASDQPSASGGQEDSPASLKVFVHRCLLPCKTQNEKDEVMEQVQKLIQEAIMSNNLHIKDWSQVPLVRPRSTSFQQQQSVYTSPGYWQASQNSSNHSYYGPTLSPETANMSHFAIQYQSATKRNNTPSYYGPGDISETHQTKKHKDNGFDQSTLALKSREKRFVGPGGIGEASSSSSAVEDFGRFMGRETIGGKTGKLTEEDFEKMTVKGTCLELEKEYLRLTAPPRPELVRPEAVLREHLENMKQERRRPNRRDYIWFCSQLKAIRQDCTVQRIQNSFTIDVYETHARIALEENDLNEYNQCQTQLKELYRTLHDDTEATQNIREFLAYRLLYYVFLMENKKYTGGSSDLFHLMLSLSPTDEEDPAIHHALLVREAVAELNYHLFFRLRLSCPNLGAFLMDHIIPTMRFNGLQRICRVYRPTVELDFVAQELGFGEDMERCRKYLQSCSCLLSEDGAIINTKDTVLNESDLEQKESLI
ncbi:hypothetical protein FisN_9Lh173 [Fistulifera solaris]|uniref:SAC3/GANP/THP3 conserved domain-containing protein n=1 Tax=Fistulifera solaris TaxID=1519565 RepID=A0A1Z5KKS5_FISSO|nr:hypothetical protein FisN_9Lh173 [Fistulifera solaris]|eukprot:GAX26879.1 hypothetical protein FisN_9Lh173 [Fistulifera solaris]